MTNRVFSGGALEGIANLTSGVLVVEPIERVPTAGGQVLSTQPFEYVITTGAIVGSPATIPSPLVARFKVFKVTGTTRSRRSILDFVGEIAESNDPITLGDIYRAAGPVVEVDSPAVRVGDPVTLLDLTDLPAPGGLGDVVGPAVAVHDNIVAFNTTTGKLVKDSGTTVTALLALIAAKASPADITAAFAAFVAGAPGALDSWLELVTAINSNPAAVTDLITAIALKVAKAGDTMTGPLVLSGAPTIDLHAATKLYVDSNSGAISADEEELYRRMRARLEPLRATKLTGLFELAIADTPIDVLAAWSCLKRDTFLANGPRYEVRIYGKHRVERNTTLWGRTIYSHIIVSDPAGYAPADAKASWLELMARIETGNNRGYISLYGEWDEPAAKAPALFGDNGAVLLCVDGYDTPYTTLDGTNTGPEIGDGFYKDNTGDTAWTKTLRQHNPTLAPLPNGMFGVISYGNGTPEQGANEPASSDIDIYFLQDDDVENSEPLLPAGGTHLQRKTWNQRNTTDVTTMAGAGGSVAVDEQTNQLKIVAGTTGGAYGVTGAHITATFVRDGAGGEGWIIPVYPVANHLGAAGTGKLLVGVMDGSGLTLADFAHAVEFDGSAAGDTGFLTIREDGATRNSNAGEFTKCKPYRIYLRSDTTGTGIGVFIQGGPEYPAWDSDTFVRLDCLNSVSVKTSLSIGVTASSGTHYIGKLEAFDGDTPVDPQTGPSLIVQDTMTDTNGTAYSSHVPELGGSPTVTSGGAPAFAINGNRVGGGSVYVGARAHWECSEADVTITLTVYVNVGSVQNGEGILFNYQDDSNYWWFGCDTASGHFWKLVKVIAGTPTTIESDNVAVGTGAHVLILTTSGDNVYAQYDATVLHDADIASRPLKTATKHGIKDTTTNAAWVEFDDLEIG